MKVGVIILCRYASSRLPGKILLPVAGDAILGHIIERIRKTELPFVVATSVDQSDDPIIAYCEQRGFPYFRGSLDDVSRRFLECAEAQGWRYAVRINGDNLFVDSQTLSLLATKAEMGQTEFLTNVPGRTFPPGASIEIIDVSCYRRLTSHFDGERYREHVTLYIYEHPGCCSQYTYLNPNVQAMAGLNIAIDTSEDYERALKVVSMLPGPLADQSLSDVTEAFKQLETNDK